MDESIDLVGESVQLRSTTPADRAPLLVIRTTPEVRRRWLGDDVEADFDAGFDDEETHHLTILDRNGRIIGLIQFAEEDDPDYRHASIDIYIDPAVHRRGYGRDALRTLASHLFDARDHHRITIDPAADNAPAIACYSSVGFQPVGLMRAYERQTDGSWTDTLLMDLLAGDRP